MSATAVRRGTSEETVQTYTISGQDRVWDDAETYPNSVARSNIFDFSPQPGVIWDILRIRMFAHMRARNPSGTEIENYPIAQYALSFEDQLRDDVELADLDGNTSHFPGEFEHIIARRVHFLQLARDNTNGLGHAGHYIQDYHEWTPPGDTGPLVFEDNMDLNMLAASSYPAGTTTGGGEETIFGEFTVMVDHIPRSR